MPDKKVIIVDGDVSKEVLDTIRNRLSEHYVVYTLAEAHQLDLSLNIVETAWRKELQEATKDVIKENWVTANDVAYIKRLARSLGPACDDLQRNMREQHFEESHPKHKHKHRPPRKLTKCKKGWR